VLDHRPSAVAARRRIRVRRMRYEPEFGSTPRATTRVSARRRSTGAEPDGPLPRRVGADQDAVRRALGRPLRLAMEVLDGRRPTAHLEPHFAEAPARYWRAATEQRRVRAPARLMRVLLHQPRPGAVEVSAVCDIDGRVRALAARFEQPSAQASWRCTALRLG
jgi:hypothetical protein